MSSELRRIEDQLKRALEGDAWHGPAVLETLQGVTAAQAHAHPITGAHSIWEVVLHLSATYGIVLRRIRGNGRPIRAEEDWALVPPATETNWQEAVGALRRVNAELRDAVRAFPADRLDEPLVPDPPYTVYTQFIGITQHDLYHAGQISLLKRALG
jgi:uncharacterized damage-inducible protein DinB